MSMPDLDGASKLVLAFDIGTIYSSVSYCILQQQQVPEVLSVARFPAQGIAHTDTKVPSLLYYDRTGTVRAAGAEVLTQDVINRALTEGWMKAECWKLHLCPKHLSPHLDNDLPPLPSGKSAVDVLTDFIKYLLDCAKTYILECHPTFTWPSVEHSIEYIFTYPGGWADQRYLYFRAIEHAGIVLSGPEGKNRVHIMTEGEAGFHLCASHLDETMTSHAAREVVLFIDAGGGITSLSMFSVTYNPVSCEVIAPAESWPEGSIFVTHRAKALIERKLDGWERSSPGDIARITQEFDQTTKPIIESDREPAYIEVAGRRTNSSKHCIASGQLKLLGEEATALFSDSVDAVIDSFEQQQKLTATPVTSAFLVGGLSANDWVWSRLQSYFMAQKIKIHRLDNHSYKVVANGAVLSRVDPQRHLEVPRAIHGSDCAPPVRVPGKEHMNRKATLRDCMAATFARVVMLARTCNLWRWFALSERDLADTVRAACHRDSLSNPKWVDQDHGSVEGISESVCDFK